MKQDRSYSLMFRFLNFLTFGQLKKYLTKTLISLIKARGDIGLLKSEGTLHITSSSALLNINEAIELIYKIFEI